jgi:hypothetical protein
MLQYAKLSDVAIEKRMQPLLVSHWEFKRLLVARDDEYLADTVEQHRAAAAMRQMALDLTAKSPIYVALNIGGKIPS